VDIVVRLRRLVDEEPANRGLVLNASRRHVAGTSTRGLVNKGIDPRAMALRQLLVALSDPTACFILGAGASAGLVPFRPSAASVESLFDEQGVFAVDVVDGPERRYLIHCLLGFETDYRSSTEDYYRNLKLWLLAKGGPLIRYVVEGPFPASWRSGRMAPSTNGACSGCRRSRRLQADDHRRRSPGEAVHARAARGGGTRSSRRGCGTAGEGGVGASSRCEAS
jgi:hypothetical protein